MLYTARDKNGWRVPLEGTVSRYIYDLIKVGKKPRQIAEILDHNINSVRVLIHRFKHPEEMNARMNIDYHVARGHDVVDYRKDSRQ
jgi:transposase-like protein